MSGVKIVGGKILIKDGKPVTDGNCCCFDCLIYSDDFSADNIGTHLDDVSGTWTVGSGVLSTSSSAALIVTVAESDTGNGYVSVNAQASNTGTKLRVVGAYVDVDNYIFGELTLNGASSQLKLFQRTGGVNSQLGSTKTVDASTATYYPLVLCWNGDEAAVTFDIENTGGATVVADCSATGPIAGLEITLTSGSATFDDFNFFYHFTDDDACPECGDPVQNCNDSATYPSVCEDAIVPDALRVTFQASVDGGATCATQCSQIISASHIVNLLVAQASNDGAGAGSGCFTSTYDENQCEYIWNRSANNSGGCSGMNYQITVTAWRITEGWVLKGTLSFTGGGVDVGFYQFVSDPLTEPVNCADDFEGIVLNLECTDFDADCIASLTSMTVNNVRS